MIAIAYSDGQVDEFIAVGGPCGADRFTLSNCGSCLHQDVREIGVRGAEAATVVHGHRKPAGHRTCERYSSPGRR